MGYDDNQKTDFIQRRDTKFRKITGLWKKKLMTEKGREFDALKGGRMNMASFDNMQAFGEKTILLVVPNVKKRKNLNSPDYFLVAVEDYAKD